MFRVKKNNPNQFSFHMDEHPSDVPIAVHDLTVSYSRKPVLWDVDLNVPKGKLVAIVGPNGAGKSTLLKSILHLIPIASGAVKINGGTFKRNKHLIGYVPQRESVDWNFPVNALDTVVMGMYRKIGWCLPVLRRHKEFAMECLRRVGMEDFYNRQISQLSGGQQQRVFIARALAERAEIFLMDEPFAGVDARTERAIVTLLKEISSSGNTVLAVHHDLNTVREYFDHVILLNLRIIDSGSPDSVLTEENLRRTYGGRLTLLDKAATALSNLDRE
tara:strand:- start:39792 stop:40613 length:822 start_codon:yes stop_codon:yes gene_type:complete